MAARLYSNFINCPGCKKEVEIFNNDTMFSMELHLQSHKELDNIGQHSEPSEESKNISVSESLCLKYKEDVQLLDNDVSLSCQPYDQKHTYSHSSDYQPLLHHDSSSRFVCEVTRTQEALLVKKNIWDNSFKMSTPEMKHHKNFIHENQIGELFCNVCNIKIENTFTLPHHLKTKLHEDKVISVLTEKLPSDSRHAMEFISFHNSNLCCNLCRSTVELCSSSLHETLVNIMAHNTSNEHSSKTKNCHCDEAQLTLEMFASINSIVDDNKHVISYKLQPQFECKLCLEEIKYSNNENLLKHLIDHLSSLNHIKRLKTLSMVDELKLSCKFNNEKHNWLFSKDGVYCVVCNCSVDVGPSHLRSAIAPVVSEPTNVKVVPSAGFTKSQTGNDNTKLHITSNDTEKNKSVNYKQSSIVQLFSGMFTKVEGPNEDVLLPIQNPPNVSRNEEHPNENVQSNADYSVSSCGILAVSDIESQNIKGKKKIRSKKKSSKTLKDSNSTINTLKGPCNLINESQVIETESSFEEVYDAVVKADLCLALFKGMFVKYGESERFMCMECGVIMKASFMFDSLRESIYCHLVSSEHTAVSSHDGDKISITTLFEQLPPESAHNMNLIKPLKRVNFLFCSVCCVKVPPASQQLQVHLAGQLHLKNLKTMIQ